MEHEYEVESITKARLEKLTGTQRGMVDWKYFVKWKGYSTKDNTWEPPESFDGSEQLIESFWEGVDTNGRDYNDTRVFDVGEEFIPLGPMHRNRKSLNANTSSRRPASSPSPLQPDGDVPMVLTRSKRRKYNASDKDMQTKKPSKRQRGDDPSPVPHTPTPVQKEVEKVPKRSAVSSATERPRPSPKKRVRSPSIDEIIPASDDEEAPEPTPQPTMQPQAVSPEISDINNISAENGDASCGAPHEADVAMNALQESTPAGIPFHRARVTNPRIKMVEDPRVTGMGSALSTRARLMGPSNPTSSDSPAQRRNAKPGPGRSSFGFMKKNTSSLLTFEKGKLKTVKGKYEKIPGEVNKQELARESTPNSIFGDLDNNDGIPAQDDFIPPMPPTAEELLELAGAKESISNSLPDFEEDDLVPVSLPLQVQDDLQPEPSIDQVTSGNPNTEAEKTKSALQQSLEQVKGNLFPFRTTSSVLAPAWKTPTIFGPLALGSAQIENTPSCAENSAPIKTFPFSLNIDPSISVPVLFSDLSDSLSPPVNAGSKAPPGKYYGPETTPSLLNILRTGGPSAKVVLSLDATEEQRTQFTLFCERLAAGSLFVAIAGVEILAFCSAGQTLLCQRLNIPQAFTGKPSDCLVTRVVIDNYSDFAALALKEAKD